MFPLSMALSVPNVLVTMSLPGQRLMHAWKAGRHEFCVMQKVQQASTNSVKSM
jgi:hypothetical protein